MSFTEAPIWIIGGTGALGSALGCIFTHLHPSHPSVRLIGRQKTEGTLSTRVQIEGGQPHFSGEVFHRLQVSGWGAIRQAGLAAPRLCVVAVKSHQLQSVIEELRAQGVSISKNTWENTEFLLVGNGLGIYQDWVTAFPHWAQNTSRMTCWFGARWHSPLSQLAVSGLAPIEWAGPLNEEWLAPAWESFRKGRPHDYRKRGTTRAAIEELEWRKALWNGSMNPVFALEQVTNGAGAERPDLLGRIQALVEEMLTVARAEGQGELGTSSEWVDKIRESARNTGKNLNSMAVDLALGRPTEINALTAEVCRRGRDKGIGTPECDKVVAEIFERSQKTLLHS